MKMLIVDCDYKFNRKNEPVVRLFGKNVNNGEDVVLHVRGMEPYIYLKNKDKDKDVYELKEKIEKGFRTYIKRIEVVKKFMPIGYQKDKSDVLKIILYNPRVVPELRTLLKEKMGLTDEDIFEADILFRDRFLIDMEIDGMSVIEFIELGKELKNYGLNCNSIYICNIEDIKILKDELVSIEY